MHNVELLIINKPKIDLDSYFEMHYYFQLLGLLLYHLTLNLRPNKENLKSKLNGTQYVNIFSKCKCLLLGTLQSLKMQFPKVLHYILINFTKQ